MEGERFKMKYIIERDGIVNTATNVAREVEKLGINPELFDWSELELTIPYGVVIEASSSEEAMKILEESAISLQGGIKREFDPDLFFDPVRVEIRSNSLEDLLKRTSKLYYDAGYGAQYLKGIIALKNGTWYERAEYDGSEWWEYRSLPKKPDWVEK